MEPHRESMWGALFDSTGRKLVTASMDSTVRLWEAFPWADTDYQEPKGAPLPERVRYHAREYWRQQVTRIHAAAGPSPATAQTPLPPGIPEWERDRWPLREPDLGPEQINLDGAYTGVLDAVIYPSGNEMEWDDDLSELPAGRQQFGGVWFDVRGVVWLNSDPSESKCYPDFPHQVKGITVGRRFQKIHVLHAAQRHFAINPEMGRDAQGNPLPIGTYALNYADGSRHEFEIQYGRDLRHWWWGGRGDAEPEAERAKVVWVGTNGTSRRYSAKIRLFMSTFENPHPNVEVVSVDFLSKRTPFAPFLVAMTVEL
jgi:hypothetical protein